MGQLTQVLRDVNPSADERLLVGPQTIDDAGVVALTSRDGVPDELGIALVQTVDYFPPVLDDPYLYGAVAAANALSDVYAMGGKPLSALNLAGFPKEFEAEWIRTIFQGGFDKVKESGAVIAGGHTVQSAEPLFGFAVTGIIQRDWVASNQGAKPGDKLYLTKPLGMGTMTTAGKFQKAPLEDVIAAAKVMATLNNRAAEAMQTVRAHACTDITGFGLVGHSHNIAKASGVTLSFQASALPVFPGARDLAANGVVSGGSSRGKLTLGEDVRIDDGVDPALVNIAFDAETSGGLLIVVDAARAGLLEDELAKRDVPVHAVGEVQSPQDHPIELL